MASPMRALSALAPATGSTAIATTTTTDAVAGAARGGCASSLRCLVSKSTVVIAHTTNVGLPPCDSSTTPLTRLSPSTELIAAAIALSSRLRCNGLPPPSPLECRIPHPRGGSLSIAARSCSVGDIKNSLILPAPSASSAALSASSSTSALSSASPAPRMSSWNHGGVRSLPWNGSSQPLTTSMAVPVFQSMDAEEILVVASVPIPVVRGEMAAGEAMAVGSDGVDSAATACCCAHSDERPGFNHAISSALQGGGIPWKIEGRQEPCALRDARLFRAEASGICSSLATALEHAHEPLQPHWRSLPGMAMHMDDEPTPDWNDRSGGGGGGCAASQSRPRSRLYGLYGACGWSGLVRRKERKQHACSWSATAEVETMRRFTELSQQPALSPSTIRIWTRIKTSWDSMRPHFCSAVLPRQTRVEPMATSSRLQLLCFSM
ncbi:hypothetical protein CBR_g51266 [Chara braunii]|uniref:Uncharacterized protein n=1 Tax=Chara braunii TaxID=69332 RepID=A0A388M885_CHABU|nr:hypothetical protein CBR_g51266 [Chara braunii]|eukprot:GBG90760.1 hypothetical protein CBR_g51266 [Chara braunii]